MIDLYIISVMMTVVLVIFFKLSIEVYGKSGGYIGLVIFTATLVTLLSGIIKGEDTVQSEDVYMLDGKKYIVGENNQLEEIGDIEGVG